MIGSSIKVGEVYAIKWSGRLVPVRVFRRREFFRSLDWKAERVLCDMALLQVRQVDSTTASVPEHFYGFDVEVLSTRRMTTIYNARRLRSLD